jgi:fatty acid desaturase
MPPAITDPQTAGQLSFAPIRRIGEIVLRDTRDIPFVGLILTTSCIVLPSAVLQFLAPESLLLAAAHLALVAYFLGPMVLMLHNLSHRPALRPRFAFLRHYLNWILLPLFGLTPNTYYAHHIGMHHPENNLQKDLSCTMRYQRDSLIDFGRYFLRFLIRTPVELPLYLLKRRSRKLFWRASVGEAAYYVVVLGGLHLNWRATLVVGVLPFLIARLGMMAGNWAQHAFVDPRHPGNTYRSSITCINTSYNRRCFNDGYHIGHHLSPNRHWTEMPADFLANWQQYRDEKALVFDRLDYFMIWACLMGKRYKTLARHVVDLEDFARTQEEIVSLLKERTRRFKAQPRPIAGLA